MLTYIVYEWRVLVSGKISKTRAPNIGSDLLSVISSQAMIMPNSVTLMLMGPPTS